MEVQGCQTTFKIPSFSGGQGGRRKEEGGRRKEATETMTRILVFDIEEKSKVSNQYKHIYQFLFSGGISYYSRHCLRKYLRIEEIFVILPHFSPIIESLDAVISHSCGNKSWVMRKWVIHSLFTWLFSSQWWTSDSL